jgi:DNA/RNA endonuclease YhcR with UshA esterase domain
MKYFLIFILLTSLSFIACQDSEPIESSEAKNHLGKYKTIRGLVAGYHEASQIGKPNYLNLGKDHPNQDLSVVVFGNFEAKYKIKMSLLKGKQIKVSGLISKYKGSLQVKNPTYIRLD